MPPEELKKLSLAHSLRSLGTKIDVFAKKLYKNEAIEKASKEMLEDKASYFKMLAAKTPGKTKVVKWEFIIEHDESLQFKVPEDYPSVKPDLFCHITGELRNGKWQFSRINTVVRIWSTGKELAFRKSVDNPEILKALSKNNWRRVLLRLHFDLADPKTPYPKFHTQVGGRHNDQDTELCWFPEKLDVPRIMSLPLDLFLGAEMIVCNFFPRAFYSLCEDGNWLKAIKWSTDSILKPELRHYFQLASSVRNESVLQGSLADRTDS